MTNSSKSTDCTTAAAPNRAELRRFGLSVGGVFGLLGVYLTWRHHLIPAWALLLLATWLLGCAVVSPVWLGRFYRHWCRVAGVVGHYMGQFWFSLIYFVVFAPTARIASWCGFDPLRLRGYHRQDSYWIVREHELTHNHYEKQFSVERKTDES